YREIIKVCALEKDFQQFPYGDKTLVGERGASLSGGQRARINMARAVYYDADIYLFDDPLSAVDTHVGKHLFEECIKKYLKNKTRILVTHQLQFLKEADLIIMINKEDYYQFSVNGLMGKIEKVGKYSELSESEGRKKEKEKPIEVHIRERLQSITSIGSSSLNEEPEKTDELVEKGAIPTSVYVDYCRAGASIFVLYICGTI
ncbi:hypothetical protein NQ317_015663, partial [Molorchus minor]